MRYLYHDYRWGCLWYINDFITSKVRPVEELVKEISTPGSVIRWNYSQIRYPLDFWGQPAPQGGFEYSKRWWWWTRSYSRDYIWLFPTEVLLTKLGICVDTANLVCSLLNAIKSESMVVLGSVLDADTGDLLGYHAWVECADLWLETTIHQGQGDLNDVMVTEEERRKGYKGLKYVPEIYYDDTMTKEETKHPIMLRFFGPGTPFNTVREFLSKEKIKQQRIWNTRTREKAPTEKKD